MTRRLYRSRADRMVGGVCGGLGEYLGIDSVWVRLFFVLLVLGQGIGFALYLILWIIIPQGEGGGVASSDTMRSNIDEIGSQARRMGEDLRGSWRSGNNQAPVIVGVALVIIGLVYLLQNLNFPWLHWLRFDILWPLLLLAGGIALIVRQIRGD